MASGKWTLTKKDKEVIDSFVTKTAAESKKMHSDGIVLAKGIAKLVPVAEWKTGKRKGRKYSELVGLTPERTASDKKIMAYIREISNVGELGSRTKMKGGESCAMIKFSDIQKLMKAAGVKGSSMSKNRRFTATKVGKVFYDGRAKCWMWELMGTSSLAAVGPAPVRTFEGMRGIAYLFASVQMCKD